MKKYLLKYKKQNLFIFLLIFITSSLSTFGAVIHMFAFDDLIAGDTRAFVQWYILAFGIYGFYLTLGYFSGVYQEKITQKMTKDLRLDIVQAIEKASFQQYMKNTSGDYISWLSNDLNTINQQGFKSFYGLVNVVCLTSISMFTLLSLDSVILLGTIGLSFLLIKAPVLLSQRVATALGKLTLQNGSFTSILEDTLKGYETLFFLHRLSFIGKKVLQANEELVEETIEYTKVATYVNKLIMGISILCQILIILFTGLLVGFGRLTIGSMMTTGQLAGNVFNTLSQYSTFKVSIDSTKEIFKKFDDFIEKSSEPGFVYENEDFNLNIQNLSYSNGERKIFERFDYVFEMNKKYLVTGASGAGKSTLLKLLSGVLSIQDGEVKIGNTTYINSERQQKNPFISHVTQESYLFSDTIYNNITLGEDVDVERIKPILNLLGLEKLVLDTLIDKTSTNLSGGQKQRINVARALLSQPKILLLDESTSNLDENNAKNIEQLIKNNESTVIYVTHRQTDNIHHGFDEHLHLG